MFVHPGDVRVFNVPGQGDMGDVDDPNSKPRFTLDVDRFALVYALCTFQVGDGTADLSWRLDSAQCPTLYQDHLGATIPCPFDHLYKKFEAVGTGSPISFRILNDELQHWTLSRGDVWVPLWTDPTTGSAAEWGWTVGLVDAALIVR
jgi:hypothetical protein